MKTDFFSSTAIIATVLLFTGCAAVGPDYTASPVKAPKEWNSVSSAASAEVSGAATGDLSSWWRVLDDPLLTSLVAEALYASPELHLIRARLREARARRTVAESALFPDVGATGNGRRSRSSGEVGGGGTNNLFSAGFDASWELDVFGGLRRSVEAADADIGAAAADLNDARVSLVAEVALNYVEVRSYQKRLAIARDNLNSQSETLQLTEWRAQAGLVGSQDVLQARTNRSQTEAQIPSLEIGLTEAEHNLDNLLGSPPGTVHPRLAAPSCLPVVPGRVAVGIPADTLRRRPDVRAAERSLAAATARVGVAEAARYPSFNLTGSIGVEALTANGLTTADAATTSLLAAITAPIFNAGRLRGQVEIQDALREQAQVSYEQTVLGALQEVENALVSLTRTADRSKALADAADAARNAAELARLRYSGGLIDFQSVLDTERTVLSVEDSLAGSRADGVLAFIRLYKALGGGWSPQPEFSKTARESS